MKPIRSLATALACIALVGGIVVSAQAGRQDDPFEKLKTYDFQSYAPVDAIRKQIDQSLKDRTALLLIEQKLDGVLADPNATFAGKQEAARFLWIIGTDRSVPTLAKLLTDPKLSDIARYALERNTDPAAGRALRMALTTTSGKTQIGIISSLGDRGDAEAVSALRSLTSSADPVTSEAAITALGKIGTESALTSLRALPATNLIAGRAMIRTAIHLADSGKKAEAFRVLEGLAGESHPALIRAEALRGLVTQQSSRAAAMTLSFLTSSDPYLQEVAAEMYDLMRDPATTNQAISAWSGLQAPTQIALLTVLSERREPAAAPIALTAIDSQDPALRSAGIRAAGRIGGAKAATRLIDLTLHGNGQDRNTAREGLINMPGAEAEQTILRIARNGQPDERATLMGVLAERPSPTALTLLLETARGNDPRPAVEAIRALGRVGGPNEHVILIKMLVSTQSEEIRDAAKDAVVAIGQRMGDRNRASEPVLAALPGASSSGKAALLPVLAEIGGDRALEELTQATKTDDVQVKQTAVRVLADTWGDTRPLPTLLAIAKSDPDKTLRIQALRGYLRLVGQDERMPAEEKVADIA